MFDDAFRRFAETGRSLIRDELRGCERVAEITKEARKSEVNRFVAGTQDTEGLVHAAGEDPTADVLTFVCAIVDPGTCLSVECGGSVYCSRLRFSEVILFFAHHDDNHTVDTENDHFSMTALVVTAPGKPWWLLRIMFHAQVPVSF